MPQGGEAARPPSSCVCVQYVYPAWRSLRWVLLQSKVKSGTWMTKIKDTELSGFTLHGGPPEGDISESEIAQSGPTLCDPMDCSLPGSSVHGVLQARVLVSEDSWAEPFLGVVIGVFDL